MKYRRPQKYKIISGKGVRPKIPDPPSLTRYDPGFDPYINLEVGEWAYNQDDRIWFFRSNRYILRYTDHDSKVTSATAEIWDSSKIYYKDQHVAYTSTNLAFKPMRMFVALDNTNPGESPETHPDKWKDSGEKISATDIEDVNLLLDRLLSITIPDNVLTQELVGQPYGLAPLGSDGKVPDEYLPAYSTSTGGGDGITQEFADLRYVRLDPGSGNTQTIKENVIIEGDIFATGNITAYYTGGDSGGIVMPIASNTDLGMIKVGANLVINADGVLSIDPAFQPGLDTAAVINLVNTNDAIDAYNAARLGSIAAGNYWHNANSNTATVDWTVRDLKLNRELISGFSGVVQRANFFTNDGNEDFHLRMGLQATGNYSWLMKYVGSTNGADGNEWRVESEYTGNFFQFDHNGNFYVKGTIYASDNIVAYSAGDVPPSGIEMPIATTTDLGMIKVGANLTIEADGTLGIDPSFTPSFSEQDVVNIVNTNTSINAYRAVRVGNVHGSDIYHKNNANKPDVNWISNNLTMQGALTSGRAGLAQRMNIYTTNSSEDIHLRLGYPVTEGLGWFIKYVGSTSGTAGNQFRVESENTGNYFELNHDGEFVIKGKSIKVQDQNGNRFEIRNGDLIVYGNVRATEDIIAFDNTI